MTRNVNTTEVTEQRQWHDGFIVHPSLASFAAHKRYLRRLTEEQWASALRLLQDGFVLGVVAQPDEAVDATAEAASRFKIPLLATYSEEDTMLYLAIEA